MNFKNLLENLQVAHKTLFNSASNAVNTAMTIRNWLYGYYIVEYGGFFNDGPVEMTAPVWVRDAEMACRSVWINEDNMFQFVFIYPYADNNWVKIYDMAGSLVYEMDMPWDNPNLIVDLPDGMYTVKTFHDQPEPLQTFVIGKP